MARKRIIFLRPLQTFLKFLLHLGLSLLLIISSHANLLSASSLDYRAKILTQKGHEQLQQGQAHEALKTWSEAYKIYRSSSNSDGVTGSLINQSLALKALGLYPRACQTLIQALKFEDQDWICANTYQNTTPKQQEQLIIALDKQPLQKIQLLGLQNLGNILQFIGKADISEIVLKKALSIAQSFKKELYIKSNILLNLADTECILYEQALDKYQITEEPIAKEKAFNLAIWRFYRAVNFYQQVDKYKAKVIDKKHYSGIWFRAQLNQLDLLLKSEILDTSQKQLKIQSLTRQLLTANFKELPAVESINAQIKFSNALIQIASDTKMGNLFSDSELSIALYNTMSAWQLAHQIGNKRAESLALENLSKIYNYLGKFQESQKILEQALALAQSIQSWDIAYQLQHNLGYLYKKLGKLKQAQNAYLSAIKTIEEIQKNSTLSFNPIFKFSFKDKIEPIYQEYLDLLLLTPQPNFQQIIYIKERLLLAELKNFLHCSYLPSFTTNEIDYNSTYNPKYNSTNITPTIYIFKLRNQVEIIVKPINGSFIRQTQNLEEVVHYIDNLINVLQSSHFFDIPEENFLFYSQKLYNLLIAPIKKYLPKDGSLVFVLDTYFQNIPFNLMHDGKKYLIDSYSISTSITSNDRQAFTLTPESLKVLIAGISQSNPNLQNLLVSNNLSPLPEVQTEITSVKHSTTDAIELIDADFTVKRFQKLIIKTDFPLVHVSSHGKFSSDPEQTFILAWDQPINVRQFEFLIKNRRNPIELLVLSACQTAKGDKRSALGIAGVTVMAGARSTLATLWLVDAESTAQLMGKFYEGLQNGLNQDQALRYAQLNLLKNPKYSHPYYWAPFILVSR